MGKGGRDLAVINIMCVFVVREDGVLALMKTMYMCVVRGYLLLAPITLCVCGNKRQNVALINTSNATRHLSGVVLYTTRHLSSSTKEIAF